MLATAGMPATEGHQLQQKSHNSRDHTTAARISAIAGSKRDRENISSASRVPATAAATAAAKTMQQQKSNQQQKVSNDRNTSSK
jgi:hypothetical protein